MMFSSDQVAAYFDHIWLPQDIRSILVSGPSHANALQALTILQHHHMSRIPFENLEFHYSPQHKLTMDVPSLYSMIIERKRGGTCFQVHQVFLKLLRTLGFEAYMTAARVNTAVHAVKDIKNLEDGTEAIFGPWFTTCVIVSIQGCAWLFSTCVHLQRCAEPLPLTHGATTTDIPPRQRRLIQVPLPGFTDEQKYWGLQGRASAESPWVDLQAFTETEWSPNDIYVLYLGLKELNVSTHRNTVMASKMEVEGKEPTGYLLLWGDTVTRWYKGKMDVINKFYSEEERLEVLQRDFGIVLKEEEKHAIKGMGSELVDSYDFFGAV